MKNRKRISILLVLAMVMTMLAGLAAPAAATTPVTGVVIGGVPTVVGTGDVTLASIRFAESGASIGNIQTGDQITITLPSGVVFQGVAAAALAATNSLLFEESGVDVTHPVVTAGATSVTLTLQRNATAFEAASFIVKLPVNVTTVGSGAINVTVATTTTAISGGTFAAGTFGTAAITMDGTGTVGTISRFAVGPQPSTITIRLRENAAGAFRPDTASLTDDGNQLVLELPEGVTWAANPTNLTGGSGLSVSSPANRRRLNVKISAATSPSPVTFTLSGIALNVSRLAALGDLTVTVTGEGENSGRVSGSVVLARVADFDITVRRPETGATARPNINAGRANADALNSMIEIKETTAGSLITGGTITLTLPAGVRFNAAALPAVTAGLDIAIAAPTPLSNDNRTATFDVSVHGSPRTVFVNFPTNAILVSPTAAAGDIAVTVAGTAGAAGTVNIAAVRPVATFTTPASPTLGLGTAGQSAADIVITEAAPGRLATGDLTLTLPTGVVFSGIPTVTRQSGNITLGSPTLSNVGGISVLTFNISAASSVASVVYVSGVRYDVGRTAMDGPINVTVDGDPIVAANVAAAFSATVAGNRPRVVNARSGVAVAPRPVSVFTVGALTFVRDGVTTTMTVAPYIEAAGNRTMLPLRYAALAVGVSEDDIIWDATRRTVTLLRGERVVQLRIGDRTMTINGVVIPLDVPAAITNGRTVLPISAVARALRASIAWDATARTVTVTAQ